MPSCPRCGAAMQLRHRRDDGTAFFGCVTYPRCKGTVKAPAAGSGAGPAAAAPPPTDLATLQTTLRQVTRERDTLRAGYEQLLGEVRQLRRLKAPAPAPLPALVRALTHLLTVIHPDKWGGESAVATALTQAVVALRDRLQTGRL